MTETFDPEQYLKDSVMIDDLILDEEFIRVPADLAFWSARYAESVKAHLMAKLNRDKVKGQRRLEIKAEDELSDKKKKMTADDLDAAVDCDVDYLTAAVETIEAEAEMRRLRGCAEAVAAKKDMVQSLGAKLRTEMERDPLVKHEQQNRR